MRRLLLVMCVGWLSLAGCSSEKPAANTSPPQQAGQPSAAAAAPPNASSDDASEAETARRPTRLTGGEEITSGEYYEAALRIEAAAESRDEEAFANFFDMRAIADSALRGIDFSAKTRSDFIRGFTAQSIGVRIMAEMKDQGSYRFLRLRRRRGQYYALFRIVTPGAGMNYHELHLVKQPTGEIRVVDFYVAVTGEMLSQTVRRAALPLAAQENRNVLQKLLKVENEYTKNLPAVLEMQQSIAQGNPQRTLTLYRTLPASMQEDKIFLLMRYRAASDLQDEAEQTATFNDCQRLFPGDPCLDLLQVDVLLAAGKIDDMLACIDRIDRSVGGDTYLDALRAGGLSQANRWDEAEAFARRAAKDPQAIIDAHWIFIGIKLARQDHPGTLQCLLEVERRYGIEFQDLMNFPEYAHFVQSPEYQQWLERN